MGGKWTHLRMRSWMEVMGVSVSSPSCRSYVRRTRLSTMHTCTARGFRD